MMSQQSSTIAINPALSFGLNFDSSDLRANQQGKITSRQVRILRGKRRQPLQPPSLLARIRGSLLYLVYGVTPEKHQWNLVGADITATVAHQQQGQVILPKSTPGKYKGLPHVMYQILVGRQSIQVDRRALKSFRDREPYTIYYAPKSKLALSAEID